MIEVQLTWPEVLVGATIGVQRQLEALMQGRPDRHGFDGENGWTVHIEGACGELAVARVIDRYWAATVNTFKDGGDIDRKVQVRTRSKHHYELLIRPDDGDDDVFVLVTGRAPMYRVVGWILGRDAKQAAFLQEYGNRPKAYFVPHAALSPFEPRS